MASYYQKIGKGINAIKTDILLRRDTEIGQTGTIAVAMERWRSRVEWALCSRRTANRYI